jgi:hypothetical protein
MNRASVCRLGPGERAHRPAAASGKSLLLFLDQSQIKRESRGGKEGGALVPSSMGEPGPTSYWFICTSDHLILPFSATQTANQPAIQSQTPVKSHSILEMEFYTIATMMATSLRVCIPPPHSENPPATDSWRADKLSCG